MKTTHNHPPKKNKSLTPICLVNGEKVSLKKGKFGYRVIHPIKNEDGTTNWINLLIGGWGNFFKLIAILLIIGGIFYGFHEVTSSCSDLAKNPCKYTNLDCSNRNNYQDNNNWDIPKINISGLT